MDSNKRPPRGESPLPPQSPEGLPFGQDGADVRKASGPPEKAPESSVVKPASSVPTSGQDKAEVPKPPDVPPDVNTASNGHVDPPAMKRAEPPKPKADPFDIRTLRLNQNSATGVGVKKILMTIPVTKPTNEWFVRTHPGEEFWLTTSVLELKGDRDIYLVGEDLQEELATEPTFAPRILATAINRQGVVFLWPLRVPKRDGRIDEWGRSALDAADLAKSQWVRVTSNTNLGAYEVSVATGILPEPVWPEVDLQKIIKIAFANKMISERSHPILQRLRGEI